MWNGYTNTDAKKMETALKQLEKCNGDCKHCEKCHIYFSHNSNPENSIYATYYAFGCDLLPKDHFDCISDTMRNLRNEAIETMKFELDLS